MIIIVEGIDRVGKTTLCEKLSKELRINIHKYKGIIDYKNMSNAEETDKTLMLLQIIRETKSDLIIDRCFYTDFVYGLIERNYNEIEAKKNLILLEEECLKQNDVILLLVEPTDIKESSNKHGKDLSLHKNFFDNLFKRSKIKDKWRCTYNTLNEAITFAKIKYANNLSIKKEN